MPLGVISWYVWILLFVREVFSRSSRDAFGPSSNYAGKDLSDIKLFMDLRLSDLVYNLRSIFLSILIILDLFGCNFNELHSVPYGNQVYLQYEFQNFQIQMIPTNLNSDWKKAYTSSAARNDIVYQFKFYFEYAI